jgi:hypothetical protein
MRLRHAYTDTELLLELRRRGRLNRVEAFTVAPGYSVSNGYPLEHQMSGTFRELGHELCKAHLAGRKLTGFKVEHGDFGRFGNSGTPDRKITVPCNYVIGDL